MSFTADRHFLLTTPLAQTLYHTYAAPLPIVDFHNHLYVPDLLADRQYENLAALWLLSDPYKHRAMRICGVEERLITGEAEPYEKFRAWCSVFPRLIGNPLYHWSQMELSKVFSIDTPICGENAEYIWDAANEQLRDTAFSARGLLRRFQVEYAAPCCGVTEDISVFEGLEVLAPSLRGDEIFPLTLSFVQRLESCTETKITNLAALKQAFSRRLDAFHRAGCRFSDHALDDGFVYLSEDGKNDERFMRLLRGEMLHKEDADYLHSAVLRLLGELYAAHNWVMQLHSGARRHTSSRLRKVAGPAGGFAAIGNSPVAAIIKLLDDLESTGDLPRTLLFTLNPADNAALSVLSGSFNEEGVPSKVQQGTAWWWCDHITGMREVFESFSAYSVLSAFLGMTTDSRSLLSFMRHEYFRRIFCGWLGEKAEKGELPKDAAMLKELVEKVCYQNAKAILSV